MLFGVNLSSVFSCSVGVLTLSVDVFARMCARVCVFVRACMRAFVHVCMCVYVCMYVCAWVCVTERVIERMLVYKRKRERVCVCVCVCMCLLQCVHSFSDVCGSNTYKHSDIYTSIQLKTHPHPPTLEHVGQQNKYKFIHTCKYACIYTCMYTCTYAWTHTYAYI